MVIYCLIDPRNNEVRYIGQTIVKPENRLNQHIYQWKRCGNRLNHLNSWIKNLSKDSLKPKLEIIDTIDNIKELDFWEQHYISLYRSWNINLTNSTLGGGGIRGFKQREESKIKRLKSLENSECWKIRNKRHSEIMKDLHKKGKLDFGYSKLTEERRKEIALKISKNNKSKKKITLKHKITNEILNFDSIEEASKYLKCAKDTIKDLVFKKRKRSIKLNNYTTL
jgi:hypothetical protein